MQSVFAKATMMSNSLTLGGNRNEVLEVVTVTVTISLMSEFSEVGVGIAMTVAGQ